MQTSVNTPYKNTDFLMNICVYFRQWLWFQKVWNVLVDRATLKTLGCQDYFVMHRWGDTWPSMHVLMVLKCKGFLVFFSLRCWVFGKVPQIFCRWMCFAVLYAAQEWFFMLISHIPRCEDGNEPAEHLLLPPTSSKSGRDERKCD